MSLELIIVRLLPDPPTDAATFTQYLQGLTIDAYDQDVINVDPISKPTGTQEVLLGSASGLLTFTNGQFWGDILQPIDIPPAQQNRKRTLPNSIIQHAKINQPLTIPPIPPFADLKAVATAVIVVDIQPLATGAVHHEYPTVPGYDIRLDIKRNGISLEAPPIEWNASVYTVQDLSVFATDYMGIKENGVAQPGFPSMNQPSLYSLIPAAPAPIPPGTAAILLDKNGKPPNFDLLLNAVNLVLGTYDLAAGTKLENLSTPLTEQQCNEIASEIAYNRALFPLPPPVPPFPPAAGSPVLEDLYTAPNTDNDQARNKFEGSLISYHAKLDTVARKLSKYIFTASASIAAEARSVTSDVAGMTFPLDPRISGTTAITSSVSVILTSWDNSLGSTTNQPINPDFIVPAPYFYALGHQLSPSMDANQRYKALLNTTPSFLAKAIQLAVDTGILSSSESTVTLPTAQRFTLNTTQAVRRLSALISNVVASSQPKIFVKNVETIVKDWRDYQFSDAQFWTNARFTSPEYLELMLQVVSGGNSTLETAIRNANLVPPIPPETTLTKVQQAYELAKITSGAWNTLFTGTGAAPLPDYTLPGNTTSRFKAFIFKIQQIFSVGWSPPPASSSIDRGIPVLDVNLGKDVLWNVIGSGNVSLESAWDDAAIDAALSALGTDKTSEALIKQAIKSLWTLVQVTAFSTASPPSTLPAPKRFSYMEALYSRGFDSADSIAVLSQAQFQSALAGTIVEPEDGKIIYNLASNLPNNLPSTGREPDRGFQPANSGGLVNCIPPANLSPLGHIEYLHEMLAAQSGDVTLLESVSTRRGDIGKLYTTMANLNTPIPAIDLVLESLESLGSSTSPAVGIVYNTSSDLASLGYSVKTACISLDDLISVVPEHSSPAVKIEQPTVYQKLKSCFTSPELPYSRSLDVSRSYLSAISSNRYDTMHRFRRDITDFPLDPSQTPKDFQKHAYRYPVRLDIALEYLRISPDEYQTLYARALDQDQVAGLYGLVSSESESWQTVARDLPILLSGLGLKYCDLVHLQKSGYVQFTLKPTTTVREQAVERESAGDQISTIPECPPCCLKQWKVQFEDEDNSASLRRIAIFVRLWKTINLRCHEKISFNLLADICNGLRLFDSNGDINSGFIRQLAALIMLHEHFEVPWSNHATAMDASGIARTTILTIWNKADVSESAWDSTIDGLLHCIEKYARREFLCSSRGPEFLKLVASNLGPLSSLAGFTDTIPWFSNPVCTIRFVEVLAKIYSSEFTVGEILFLFTNGSHLRGDDPFPLDTDTESFDRPLSLPDDQQYNLEGLRKKLLEVHVSEEDCETSSWHQVESIIREIGHVAQPGGMDSLISMAEHFFPGILESHGHFVDPTNRRYSTPLAPDQTSPKMWAADPCKPFHYNSVENSGSLSMTIPLKNEDIFEKLTAIRQLKPAEVEAVQELYFKPRAALAPFALLFSNFQMAVEKMVQEPCEKARFDFFRRQVLLFHQSCKVISRYLAKHVQEAIAKDDCIHECTDDQVSLAWAVLKSLAADENAAKQPWENDDSGNPPTDFTWDPHFSGSAIAGILGLIGTGLEGEIVSQSGKHWAEMRGGIEAFGCVNNKWKTPVPTWIPELSLKPTAIQDDFVDFKNGFATRNKDGKFLSGAERFNCEWTGNLIVEESGCYVFSAGKPVTEDSRPDCEGCDRDKWLVTLQRGQKSYTLLKHGDPRHEKANAYVSDEVHLHKGAYSLRVQFKEEDPVFNRLLDIHGEKTGFQVKYEGPDTSFCSREVPFCNLIISSKDQPLGHSRELSDAKWDFLRLEYVSSLRDIRRTYQRAFKALLFARRFCLSAKTVHCDDESELLYLLKHAQQFQGTSFSGSANSDSVVTFRPHHAWFDFNFLPVADPFISPDPAVDSRAGPSERRQAALFDWWERMFDYVSLRDKMRAVSKRPLWKMFQEADLGQPLSGVENLLRYMKIDPSIKNLVLNYYGDSNTIYQIRASDLLDERWAVRLWRARKYVRKLYESFYSKVLEDARPALWAADDLEVEITIKDQVAESGNGNLIRFVQRSMLDSQQCSTRWLQLRKLNNGLRQRCRKEILVYLCQMNRVELSSGDFAVSPKDLSDVLLQDVEVDITTTLSRIEDAIRSVQEFVQRARLGLERGFGLTEDFVSLWDCNFASFEIWVTRRRRILYGENWIKWDELRALEDMEGTQFLQTELRRGIDTVVKPGKPLWWQESAAAAHSTGFELVQSNESATLSTHKESTIEGMTLMGTPDRHARPTLLAVNLNPQTSERAQDPRTAPRQQASQDEGTVKKMKLIQQTESPDASHAELTNNLHVMDDAKQLSIIAARTFGSIPMWIQSAIRLGSRFVRVAAAGTPPAFPWTEASPCCNECGRQHLPCIDEYYFWLQDSREFDPKDAIQEADLGTTSIDDPTAPAWEDAAQLPGLLLWPQEPSILLFWTRVHNGTLCPPRRSDYGIRVDLLTSGNTPFLEVAGRKLDSLFLTINGGQGGIPAVLGTDPGFRYDIAVDVAIVTPQVKPDVFPAPSLPPSFVSYPWFVYFAPGKPLAPVTPFGTALAIAGALQSKCRFEEALNWYRLAYDPLTRDNTWTQCPEPRDEAARVRNAHSNEDSTRQSLQTFSSELLSRTTRDLPCCPTSTINAPVLRSRAVFLDYIDTLLSWSDQLAAKNTAEAAQHALVVLETVHRLLGTAPTTVNARSSLLSETTTVATFIASPPPVSPRLLKLYEDLSNRLSSLRGRKSGSGSTFDCRSCGNSKGDGCDFDASETCCASYCPTTPCQPYRFSSIFPKAVELASLTKGLTNSLLAAYERGDQEYLAALRLAHERTVLGLGQEISQNQWRAADWDVQALDETMENAVTRLRYYKQLIATGNITGEESYTTGVEAAMSTSAGANISEGMSEVFNVVPDMSIGVAGLGPYQATAIPIGVKMAKSATAAARILNTVSAISTASAGLSLTTSGWQRRLEEWKHQVDIITIEISQIKRQKLASVRRRDVALRELNSHERQLEHSQEVSDFMRDKFTKHSLDLFLQQEHGAMLKRMFELALRSAQDAYSAFIFERFPVSPTSFPSISDFWDGGFEGLVAGDKLELFLRQLERSYMSNNCRELELNKRFSLRESFPREFIALRQHGVCEIELKEWRFDADYPGHYMRRIKSISLSIPCVAGVYTGVHCRLQLLGSSIRTQPLVAGPIECCCSKPAEKADCCCCSSCNDKENKQDPYLLRRYAATSAVATSHGQDDSGLFELSFRDERYLPFEFEGAVSRWRIELPKKNNLFDFSTLSDMILNLNFTSRDGGPDLRKSAEQRRPGCDDGMWRGFEVRREFSDIWPGFEDCRPSGHSSRVKDHDHKCHSCSGEHKKSIPDHKHGRRSEAKEHEYKIDHRNGTRCNCCSPHEPRHALQRGHIEFPLRLRRGMFPYLPGRPDIKVTQLCIYISIRCEHDENAGCVCNDKYTSKHFPVVFIPSEREDCRDDWCEVTCVQQQSGDPNACSDVYACEIGDLELGPIAEERGMHRSSAGEEFGTLRFPKSMGSVTEMWLLCKYEAIGRCEGDGKRLPKERFDDREGGDSRTRRQNGESGQEYDSSRKRYFEEDDSDSS